MEAQQLANAANIDLEHAEHLIDGINSGNDGMKNAAIFSILQTFPARYKAATKPKEPNE